MVGYAATSREGFFFPHHATIWYCDDPLLSHNALWSSFCNSRLNVPCRGIMGHLAALETREDELARAQYVLRCVN